MSSHKKFKLKAQNFMYQSCINHYFRTDIDEARVISFFLWVYRRTDRHGFGILILKHVVTQKNSTKSSKLGVYISCRLLYASPNDGDICIINLVLQKDENAGRLFLK